MKIDVEMVKKIQGWGIDFLFDNKKLTTCFIKMKSFEEVEVEKYFKF